MGVILPRGYLFVHVHLQLFLLGMMLSGIPVPGHRAIAQDGDSAPLVPDSFVVPLRLETPRFTLRKLTVDDAEADFEAVVSSKDVLHTLFGADWPPEDFTLENNREDLRVHETQFEERIAFAYTVVDSTGSRVLGSVYIVPSPEEAYDAAVLYWVRASEQDTGLQAELGAVVHEWLDSNWLFKRVKDLTRE